MALNLVWLALFFAAAATGLVRWIGGDTQVFAAMSAALFDSAKSAFELALGLAGSLMLWMGLLAIAERAGLMQALGRALAPVLRRVFPGLPADHPAAGAIVLNFAANALGLDNAATPAGLKAMRELQTLNPTPERASDHQVMFMVLHAASLTLFPVGIIALRSAAGAANAADVFLPLLITSCCSALAGFAACALVQRLRVDAGLLALLAGLVVALGAAFWLLSAVPAAQLQAQSTQLGGALLIGAMLLFLGTAAARRVDAWSVFVDGAREGLKTAIQIAPYLVGMIAAVGVLRASGALDALAQACTPLLQALGMPAEAAPAIPVALMKPLSGSAARGLFVDTMHTLGADSYAGRLAALFQGGTDTTLYVIALYSGAAGLRRLRHTLPCALFADLAGWAAALAVARLLFR